ncbi:MAG TPA: Gfo/Idh/MocA family oxidoreductase [Solirubrobacterales bacterium]
MLIRAGVIGPSGVGGLHVDALRRLGVSVIGLAAATPEIARRDAERLGVARVFASGEELIASDEVDVVHVCTPNALHLPLARAALRAGKHLVVEKPLCIYANDAEELLQMASDAGVVHALCHTYRHYPMLRALRELIARGELGRVRTLRVAWLNEELLTVDAGHWMLDPRQMGPSLSLADVGIHLWDLVEHVGGVEISEVLCETRTAKPGGGEDSALLVLRLKGGAIASAFVSQAAPGHSNTVSLEAIGERASAAWDIRAADVLTVRHLGGNSRLVERGTIPAQDLGAGGRLPPGQPEGHAEALLGLLGAVYEHVDSGEQLTEYPTFVDGVRGLQVLEALRQSAQKGRWHPVDASRRQPRHR